MNKYRFINKDYYALVTGGSEGIGFAFAEHVASLGKPIIIIALDNEKLPVAKKAIEEKYGVVCITLGLDLTHSDAGEQIIEWCRENKYEVDLLINNAGHGDTRKFEHVDKSILNTMIMLNVYTTANMCRLFIKEMEGVPTASIINVSSLAAFFPIPYKSLYASSKAFINVFTRALAEEFKHSNVSLHVVCPNGVMTNDAVRARMATHGKMAMFLGLEPTYLVEYTFSKVDKGEFLIIPKFVNRLLYFLSKNIPQKLQMKILKGQFSKEVKGDA